MLENLQQTHSRPVGGSNVPKPCLNTLIKQKYKACLHTVYMMKPHKCETKPHRRPLVAGTGMTAMTVLLGYFFSFNN